MYLLNVSLIRLACLGTSLGTTRFNSRINLIHLVAGSICVSCRWVGYEVLSVQIYSVTTCPHFIT